jgi:hypothetical protein
MEGGWHGVHFLLVPLLSGPTTLSGFTLVYWIALVYIAAPVDSSYGELLRLIGILSYCNHLRGQAGIWSQSIVATGVEISCRIKASNHPQPDL